MTAHWNMAQLASARSGLLVFTKSQSKRMTEQLCAAMGGEKWRSEKEPELAPGD